MEEPFRILIADDDEVCREILRDAIQQERVEIALAGDGIEAFEKIRSKRFDILIVDLSLPGKDGMELLHDARLRLPDILTIVICGYGNLDVAIEAVRQGAYDYIQRPFKLDEIKVPVRNAIEKVSMLRERITLLQEAQDLCKRLQQLESECERQREKTSSDSRQGETASKSYFILPRYTVPVSLLDTPEKDPDQILLALERLKELRRSDAITEAEFERLKKMYLSRAD